MKKLALGAALLASVMQPSLAQAQDRGGPSLYLRCDGEPNNMTGGEQFARFLGAITLLGIFAPAPENPDPSARLFGQEGVDACSQLIDGENGEGNPVRRVPLVLARALHQIEAKDYAAALEDVERARAEAQAAGLIGNPYFDRSMGLSFNNIAAAAHLRLGRPDLAREISLSSLEGMQYSFVPSIYANDYGLFLRDLSPAAEQRLAISAKIMPSLLGGFAARLEDVGRFEEAAEKREALITVLDGLDTETRSSLNPARAAVAHALAGNWEQAVQRAEQARSNMDERVASGQPEENSSAVIELLDLYDIIERARDGDMTMARRIFAARSQWTAPNFGTVMEVNRRLRDGASEEELFGALLPTPEEMWQKRYDDRLTVELQSDTENDDLFGLIVDYAKVDEFEDRARQTWRVESSRMMADEPTDEGLWQISATGSATSAIDAIMLHAALQAREQGKEGFTMILLSPRSIYRNSYSGGFARFINRSEEGAGGNLFIPADEVIAELSQLIPTRDQVRERERERRRASRDRDD